jgi:predicted Zn-dependent protease
MEVKEKPVQLLIDNRIYKKDNVLHWWILSFFFTILTFCCSAAAQSQNLSEYESGRKFVIKLKDRHGVCEDPQILNRVTTISDNILKVADTRSDISITFVVLNTSSTAAYALPGGFIVLTRGIIDACNSDDELAFLLAHEIAHEVKGHVASPLTGDLRGHFMERIHAIGASGFDLANDITREIKKEGEREADRLGILYMMLANYDAIAATSIFDHIIKIDESNGTHPPRIERKEIIKSKFSDIARTAEFFYLAVALYLSERYDESLELLRTCQSNFPSKVIFHNIGTVYLAKAMEFYREEAHNQALHEISSVSPEQWSTDWLMPAGIMIYDEYTFKGIDNMIKRGSRNEKQIVTKESKRHAKALSFEKYLKDAIRYFEKAVALDPEYAPSYVNWAWALLHLDLFEEARFLLEKARYKVPSDPLILNNLGVTMFGLNNHLMSLELFQKCINWNGLLPEGHFTAPYFNIGVVMMRLGKDNEAADNFCKYLKLSQNRKEWRRDIARTLLSEEMNCEVTSSDSERSIFNEKSRLLKLYKPGISLDTEMDVLEKKQQKLWRSLSIVSIKQKDFRCNMLLEGEVILASSFTGSGAMKGIVDEKSAKSILEKAYDYSFNKGVTIDLNQGIILYAGKEKYRRLTLFKKGI